MIYSCDPLRAIGGGRLRLAMCCQYGRQWFQRTKPLILHQINKLLIYHRLLCQLMLQMGILFLQQRYRASIECMLAAAAAVFTSNIKPLSTYTFECHTAYHPCCMPPLFSYIFISYFLTSPPLIGSDADSDSNSNSLVTYARLVLFYLVCVPGSRILS